MSTNEYSILALVIEGKKIVKGELILYKKGFSFTSMSGKTYEKNFDWRDIKCVRGSIGISVFLFFKVQKKYLMFENKEYHSPKFIIKENDQNRTATLIAGFSEELYYEAEKRAQEEAERLELERRAQEEAERLEAEKRAQEEIEHLEAEREAQEDAEGQSIELIENLTINKQGDNILHIRQKCFFEWCLEQGYKESTSKGYISGLRMAEKFLKTEDICNKDLLGITSDSEIRELVAAMKKHPAFKSSAWSYYVHSMNAYANYLSCFFETGIDQGIEAEERAKYEIIRKKREAEEENREKVFYEWCISSGYKSSTSINLEASSIFNFNSSVKRPFSSINLITSFFLFNKLTP